MRSTEKVKTGKRRKENKESVNRKSSAEARWNEPKRGRESGQIKVREVRV